MLDTAHLMSWHDIVNAGPSIVEHLVTLHHQDCHDKLTSQQGLALYVLAGDVAPAISI